MRLVSLLPSATEIVYALGLGDDLAGVTFECDEQAHLVAGLMPGIPVWAIDADALVVRPGPRLVSGVEAIASVLHPSAVPAPPPGSICQVA